MQTMITSDDDAANAALLAVRKRGTQVTGKVNSVARIGPGHRLALPFVNELFWKIRLELEPPMVKSRFTVTSGISDDLSLLVMQNGRVFRWPTLEDDFRQIFSKDYVTGLSLLEQIPGQKKVISKEERQKEREQADNELERMLEEADRQNRKEREKLRNAQPERPMTSESGEALELPGM